MRIIKAIALIFGLCIILTASLQLKELASAPSKNDNVITLTNNESNITEEPTQVKYPSTNWPLKVSANGRYITEADGTPFFYMCNTAWLLLHHTNYDEMHQYMDNLVKQKFSVIHFPLLSLNADNKSSDATKLTNPDPKLFNKCHDYIEYARSRNLTVNLIPVWQSSWQNAIRSMSKEQIIEFARYVGNSFKDLDNIIYSLGGDWYPKDQMDIDNVDWIAQGLKETDPGKLMTFFCYGDMSGSELFHNRTWNDFNFVQVKGMARTDTELTSSQYYKLVIDDYRKSPPKPTHLGETSYEYEFTGQIWPEVDSKIIRQTAYQTILSGAMGYTYGRRGLWHFNLPETAMGYKLHKPWQDLLQCSFSPGSCHMTFLVDLFCQYPWYKLIPSHSKTFATSGVDKGSVDFTASAVASDGTFALAYFPKNKVTTFDLRCLSGDLISAIWFDPTNGDTSIISGSPFMKDSLKISPPRANSIGDSDWILILEAKTIK